MYSWAVSDISAFCEYCGMVRLLENQEFHTAISKCMEPCDGEPSHKPAWLGCGCFPNDQIDAIQTLFFLFFSSLAGGTKPLGRKPEKSLRLFSLGHVIRGLPCLNGAHQPIHPANSRCHHVQRRVYWRAHRISHQPYI